MYTPLYRCPFIELFFILIRRNKSCQEYVSVPWAVCRGISRRPYMYPLFLSSVGVLASFPSTGACGW